MATTRYVAALRHVGREDLDVAGGKGANLGEMVRAGFRVPPGFVVTTAASPQPDLTVLDDGEKLRRAVLETEVPAEVSKAIRAAYRELGGGPVAVRSSATTEDLPEAAFAGQQDTFLNVIGEYEVLDAVRRCWASLWTDRALDYRHSRGIDHAQARIAVVVQSMVPAEFAGVLFTSDPVTGNGRHVVIDANPGLGEAVVAGLVTPEHLVADKRRRRVISRRAGRQEVLVRPLEGGGTEQVTEGQPTARLPRRAVHRLAAIGVDVERHFGQPQDIEWAWAGGAAYVLQARPITALPEQPREWGRVERAMSRMLPEIIPIRPYPLDITAWTLPLVSSLTKIIGVAGVVIPPLERVFVEEDGVVVRVEPPRPRPTLHTLGTPIRLARLAWGYDPSRWKADPLVDEMQQRARDLRARDLAASSWPDLVGLLEEGPAIAERAMRLRIRYLPRSTLALLGLVMFLVLVRRLGLLGALLSGVDTLTGDANSALEELAATVRADRRLADVFATHAASELRAVLEESFPEFLADFDSFLDRFGHRDTTTPALVTQPAWRDAPDMVLGMVQGFAAEAPPVTGPPPSLRAERELFARPLLRSGPLRTVVRRLLSQARWLQQVRDDTRFHAVLPLSTMRRAALELGNRLVVAGALDEPEDVFHLRLGELSNVGAWPPPPESIAELRDRATRRKAKRAELAGTPLLPEPESVEAQGEALLRGAPGSAGVAEGPVRIIHGVADFGALSTGDVLVAPYTNPAWTPLFRRAAAVVVDTGGMASHAAIIAREYGIPAVMGTGDGTRRLADGTPVHVDGSRGVVSPVPHLTVPPS